MHATYSNEEERERERWNAEGVLNANALAKREHLK
jgi:hypothetical protein